MNTSPHDAAARQRFERYMGERLMFELRVNWALDYDECLSCALWAQLVSGTLYTYPVPLPYTEAELAAADAHNDWLKNSGELRRRRDGIR